jgi:hypothetical protein
VALRRQVEDLHELASKTSGERTMQDLDVTLLTPLGSWLEWGTEPATIA